MHSANLTALCGRSALVVVVAVLPVSAGLGKVRPNHSPQ